ncbi:MAG: hypothetical protein ACPGSI_19040 [Pikeienuella sp.]
MGFDLKFVTALPDPLAFEAMMREYYHIMVDKMVKAGGPQHSPAEMATDRPHRKVSS